jgi:hypothetical protein
VAVGSLGFLLDYFQPGVYGHPLDATASLLAVILAPDACPPIFVWDSVREVDPAIYVFGRGEHGFAALNQLLVARVELRPYYPVSSGYLHPLLQTDRSLLLLGVVLALKQRPALRGRRRLLVYQF